MHFLSERFSVIEFAFECSPPLLNPWDPVRSAILFSNIRRQLSKQLPKNSKNFDLYKNQLFLHITARDYSCMQLWCGKLTVVQNAESRTRCRSKHLGNCCRPQTWTWRPSWHLSEIWTTSAKLWKSESPRLATTYSSSSSNVMKLFCNFPKEQLLFYCLPANRGWSSFLSHLWPFLQKPVCLITAIKVAKWYRL